MASIPPSSRVVIGGIDTHKDQHVAAVTDTTGVVLATEPFSTTRGYRAWSAAARLRRRAPGRH
jgi:transposase